MKYGGKDRLNIVRLIYLMRKDIKEFTNAAATIKFIRIFDRLWDVMNTHRVRGDTQNTFKSALNKENKRDVFKFLLEAKKYIFSL